MFVYVSHTQIIDRHKDTDFVTLMPVDSIIALRGKGLFYFRFFLYMCLSEITTGWLALFQLKLSG